MKRKSKNKIKWIILIISIFSIITGIIIFTNNQIESYNIYNDNINKVSYFFNTTKTTTAEQSTTKKEDNYIAILEIPKIKLIRGLVDTHSKYNDVNYNIQILNNSINPNIKGDNLILASHSGNSKVSFFKNLHKINNNDQIYLYYDNNKYVYNVSNKYKVDKNGYIDIKRNKENTTLTLTTCDVSDKTKQLIVIADLVNIERY